MSEPGCLVVAPEEAGKVAVVLSAELAPGPAANIAACLAAGLAAATPGWAGRELVDGAGLASVASSHVPITILRATADTMQALMQRLAAPARAHGCTLSLFPAYARAMHDGDAYGERHAASVHTDEVMLGIGLHGPKRSVNRLTGSLPLWR